MELFYLCIADRVMTISDMSAIVSMEYPLIVTPANNQSGFRVTGICLFNPDISEKSEFAS